MTYDSIYDWYGSTLSNKINATQPATKWSHLFFPEASGTATANLSTTTGGQRVGIEVIGRWVVWMYLDFIGIEPLDTQNDAIDTCLNTIILGIYVKFGLSINMYIVFIYIYIFV